MNDDSPTRLEQLLSSVQGMNRRLIAVEEKIVELTTEPPVVNGRREAYAPRPAILTTEPGAWD